jgi:hypothetical protein
MKPKILGLLALAIFPLHATDFPSSITSQIPKGYEVMTYVSGELSDDGRLDYLVVIHHADDGIDHPSSRPLLIFTQNADKTFTLAARNDDVVMRYEGGQCDPFDDSGEGLAIKNRYFTVQNGVACGEHWTDYITFHYDAKKRDWLFHKEIFESWVMNDDPNGDALKPGTHTVTQADPLHPVSFTAWRPKEK